MSRSFCDRHTTEPSLGGNGDRARVVLLWIFFWGVAIFAVAFDQWSKQYVLRHLNVASPVPIIPGFFELRLVFNPGAAFSLFQGGRYMFIAVSLAAFLFLPWYMRGLFLHGERTPVYPIGLGLILGGAVGNAIDRIFRPDGLVVDFFHVYWRDHSFPVFNIADSAITVGLGGILIAMLIPGLGSAPMEQESGEGVEKEGETDVAGSL